MTVDPKYVMIMKAGYDLVFGYKDGNSTAYNMAAGATAQGFLNLLTGAHGKFFYKFKGGGTGDVLFIPLYDELIKRGVKFKFFH
mmetsp:Transcript_44364/g.67929  ORF Transcript_44364/g.67929 Transcript_44364/m.67929 type:complete len:84 (+) Transcript_44364:743-994(+)